MSKYGFFKDNGSEYVITDYDTPRIWMNYMWNERFFSSVNQFGTGEGSYVGYAAKYNDPQERSKCFLINGGVRYFYIRDEESGEFWNPAWYPVKVSPNKYKCTYGLGYTIIESEYKGISIKLRGFVNENDPAELWSITLNNNSNRKRKIKVYSYVEFSLVGYFQYCGMQAYSYCKYHKDSNMIFAYNKAVECPHEWYNGYIASYKVPTGYDSSRDAFIGKFGDASSPLVVKEGKCTNSEASCETFIGCLENTFELNPLKSDTNHIIIGSASDFDYAKDLAEKLFKNNSIEKDFNKLKIKAEKTKDNCILSSPDERLNFLTNYWIKQQVGLCIEAGRGWMKGFRDQLQDSWGAASINPKIARKKILETLENQYSNGSCVRGFSPIDPHIYSDGPTWIAPSINGYLKETYDTSILNENVKYLDEGSGSVWEHILKSVRHSSEDLGERGLVLARDGDWNDSLNFIGLKGKGESVWTSIALYNALINTAEMAKELLNDCETEKEMIERAEKIKKSINENGWDGEWYLAGYTDNGEKVGSQSEQEGQIYLNSQTWAVFSGVADNERAKQCMKAVDKYLNSQYGPLTLFPPYTKLNENIGRLTGFVPGIWENGTPYCHGGTFKVVADLVFGRANEAYESISKILPDSALNSSDHSGAEPFALTNMYYGPSNEKSGKTMFGWVTGTAGWMYRAITQYMFGFHPEYEYFRMSPCLPDGWNKCSIVRNFRGDIYEIHINKKGKSNEIESIIMDGVLMKGQNIKIVGDKMKHIINIELRGDIK
jgi:cellobiose phosphorylase